MGCGGCGSRGVDVHRYQRSIAGHLDARPRPDSVEHGRGFLERQKLDHPRSVAFGGVSNLVIRRARVGEREPVDLRVAGGAIVEIGPRLAGFGRADELDAAGGWLIPGFHDHHLHLRALVAARSSVRLGPPHVRNPGELRAALRGAPRRDPHGWIRAVGYHESVAGDLDAASLDEVVSDRPVRVQHRSGILWVLNSMALEKVGAHTEASSRVERDDRGALTGRLWRMDRWLARRTATLPAEDWKQGLGLLSSEAAAMGVTGWTDATPGRSDGDALELAEAVVTGVVRQRLHLMVSPGSRDVITGGRIERVTPGPVKVILDDFELPELGRFVELIREAHLSGSRVAVHCVTRAQLVLTLSAFEEAGGPGSGDRIEHGAVIPQQLISRLRDQDLTVVTQPNFVGERGDDYLRSVDADEIEDLWRARSLAENGVKVACGTDAPFGDPNPWSALRSATTRRTPSGECLGPGERVDALTAASWWWGTGDEPSCPRRIEVGARADLVVLGEPLAEAASAYGTAPPITATVVRGEIAYA